jgi:hypothetical protein
MLELPGYEYRRLVPKAYWGPTGLLKYQFNVLAPAARIYTSLQAPDGSVVEVPQSALCLVLDGDNFREILIDSETHPHLFEAAVQLQGALRLGSMAEKYLAVFQAYEAVVEIPEIRFAAIRHALSHARSKLSRPKTLSALTELFGGTRIELYDLRHRRVFYKQFTAMLLETDRLFAGRVRGAWHEFKCMIPHDEVRRYWGVRSS